MSAVSESADAPSLSAEEGPGPPTGYRILMVAPTSFFGDSGCHVRILEETRALQALGNRVTICTYHNGRDVEGLDIRRTVSIPWRAGYEVGSSRHKIAFDALLYWRAMVTMYRVRPHVIHAHLHEGALIGLVLSKLFRVPLLFDFQGSMTSEMVDHGFVRAEGPAFSLLRRLEALIDRTSPHIVTSSTGVVEQLTGEFGCQPARVTPLPDCVDTKAFCPRPQAERLRVRRAWGIPEDHVVVIYLGRLAEYQGTGHLLRAARLVCARRDDVHFVIAGYPFVDRYHAEARELGIADRCTFTGRIDYQKGAPDLLAAGDLAVSPKLSQTEGAGKILNYMACGLPTVAYRSSVSVEFLGSLGVYARAGDIDDLARGILELVAAPARRAELGSALRARAQACYSWEHAAMRLLSIYASLGARPDV